MGLGVSCAAHLLAGVIRFFAHRHSWSVTNRHWTVLGGLHGRRACYVERSCECGSRRVEPDPILEAL